MVVALDRMAALSRQLSPLPVSGKRYARHARATTGRRTTLYSSPSRHHPSHGTLLVPVRRRAVLPGLALDCFLGAQPSRIDLDLQPGRRDRSNRPGHRQPARSSLDAQAGTPLPRNAFSTRCTSARWFDRPALAGLAPRAAMEDRPGGYVDHACHGVHLLFHHIPYPSTRLVLAIRIS